MSEHAGISENEIESLTSEQVFRRSVTDQFTAMNMRLSTQDVAIAALGRQNEATTEKLDVLLTQTKTMVDAWEDGAQVKRFFCRLARIWEFMIKKVALPGIATLVVVVIVRAVFWHDAVPDWLLAAVKLL